MVIFFCHLGAIYTTQPLANLHFTWFLVHALSVPHSSTYNFMPYIAYWHLKPPQRPVRSSITVRLRPP